MSADSTQPKHLDPDPRSAAVGEQIRQPGPICRLMSELQRRRVCRAIFSYSLLVWMNVQIGDVLFPMAGLPDWCLRLVIVIGLLGLPLVVFLAWTFQLTPHGLRIDDGVRAADTKARSHAERTETAISAALLVLGLSLTGWLLSERALGDSDSRVPSPSDARHAYVSLTFHSPGPEPMGLVVGLEATLRHELIQLPAVTVVADTASAISLAEKSGRLLITGTISFEPDQINAYFHALDAATGQYVWSTGYQCPNSEWGVARTWTRQIAADIKQLLGQKKVTDAPIESANLPAHSVRE